ncbi:MAG: ABC transporter permease subunit [Dehalococcoidales bacterium]
MKSLNTPPENLRQTGKRNLRGFKKYYVYYLFFLPCALSFILFNYLPMAGIVLSFKDFWPKYGVWGSPWMQPFYGHFVTLFRDPYFWSVLKNTLVISLLRLVIGFPAPIILALLFNELPFARFKKFAQTVLYLPHFLSWIILAGMFKTLLMQDGLINRFVGVFGLGPVSFLTSSGPFLTFIILSDIWKGMGFGSVLYLAALSGIDPCMYEAARIDGANRLQRIRFITLPGIAPVISIQLILSLSGILNGGFDQIYNLYSEPVYDVADIIDTYLYRIGFEGGISHNIELSTALGLFKSVVAFVLIYFTNRAANKIGGTGVW